MRTSRLLLVSLVVAIALASVAGLFFSHTSAQQTRTIHLAQGWNLVTWTGDTQSSSAALASLGDAVPVVYGYNNDSQIFARCIVGRPEISTLTNFGPEEAYWVMALRSADWSVPGPAEPSCPVATACPDCPSASDLVSDVCTGTDVWIGIYGILVDIAEKGLLVGMTEAEARAQLAQFQQGFDQGCQGVPLAEASFVAYGCSEAGRWKGMEERENLYAPDPQKTIWINQFDDIIDQYCTLHY
jgi:hypothetical protein